MTANQLVRLCRAGVIERMLPHTYRMLSVRCHTRRGRFVREFLLTWNSTTYRFDFAFPARRVILETNGRRWHDDATDYEHDQEKWSVPGRYGYRIVFATWSKIDRDPDSPIDDVKAALAA